MGKTSSIEIYHIEKTPTFYKDFLEKIYVYDESKRIDIKQLKKLLHLIINGKDDDDPASSAATWLMYGGIACICISALGFLVRALTA